MSKMTIPIEKLQHIKNIGFKLLPVQYWNNDIIQNKEKITLRPIKNYNHLLYILIHLYRNPGSWSYSSILV